MNFYFNVKLSKYMFLFPRSLISDDIMIPFGIHGDGEIRTLDPLLARQVLSQLSYTPKKQHTLFFMGLNGLEPSTSRLSGVRSNQLSYKPI